jgi:hypothetical protein
MSYLQTYTVGSIIATSWRIYFRDWLTLFVIFGIPLALAHTLNVSIKHTGGLGIAIGAITLFIASLFVGFPLTVAISEICLGIKPNVARSYQRAFAQPGKLIGTYLLTLAITLVGFILLFIPGLVFAVWYAFIGPVVVLEALSGRPALKRSRELGKGYYLRNLGVLILGQVISGFLGALLSGTTGFLVGYFLSANGSMLYLVELASGLLGFLVAPPTLIIVVLLYYDMRARKEGYGATELADDLRY